MADRTFHDALSLSPSQIDLHCEASIAAAGAPTLVTANGKSKGILSISRSAAGTYTITTQDKYVALLNLNGTVGFTTAADLFVKLKDDLATNNVVQIFTLTAAVATDPASGSILKVSLTMQNSSIS